MCVTVSTIGRRARAFCSADMICLRSPLGGGRFVSMRGEARHSPAMQSPGANGANAAALLPCLTTA